MSKNQKSTEKKIKSDQSLLDKISSKNGLFITLAVLSIILMIVFAPFLFKGLYPGGEDIVGSIGKSNLMVEWQKETGKTALWNPAIFGGMPSYPRKIPTIINLDSFISLLSGFSFWAFWYFLAGGLGIYLFMIQKKIPWYIATLAAIVFVLLPDWQAQLGAGHNAKIRALMVFPILLASFNYFFDKRDWLSTGLFALVFTWMVRTQHFQIIFYAILLLFFIYIIPYIKLWKDKKNKQASSLLIKFVIAIILTIITSSQPFLTIKEYTPHSTRGGNALVMNDDNQQVDKSGGVSFEYATQWSLAPAEILDFFIARFHGGYSQEVYNGDKFPQLKGRAIPGYWGEKPFNGNFSFIGIIIFCFALTGFILNKKNNIVIAVFAFVVFTILLSFGRHFPMLYELFFNHFPYFSKFRAPSMITNASFIGLIILAGYGLRSIISGLKPFEIKKVYSVFGSIIGLSIILLLFKDSFSFMSSAEVNRYDANTMNLLKGIRLEYLTNDLIKMLILLLLASATMVAFIKNKIKLEFFVMIISALIIFEVYTVTNMSLNRIQKHDREELKSKLFADTKVSKYLEKQPKTARAIALNNQFQSNHYAYFYPTINGYSSIKLQLIQDIIQNSLTNANTKNKINWDVINMLNGKYIITSQPMPLEFLELVKVDKQRNENLYINNNVLPKAWFVKNVKSFENDKHLVEYMNDTTFTPANEVLLLNNKDLDKQTFTGKGEIKLSNYTPNEIEISVNVDEEQFLVLAEIYYPEGWRAYADGSELEIFRVNHLLRGIKIPAGAKQVRFEIDPPTYNLSKSLVWGGNIIILGMMIGSFILERKKMVSKNLDE